MPTTPCPVCNGSGFMPRDLVRRCWLGSFQMGFGLYGSASWPQCNNCNGTGDKPRVRATVEEVENCHVLIERRNTRRK